MLCDGHQGHVRFSMGDSASLRMPGMHLQGPVHQREKLAAAASRPRCPAGRPGAELPAPEQHRPPGCQGVFAASPWTSAHIVSE